MGKVTSQIMSKDMLDSKNKAMVDVTGLSSRVGVVETSLAEKSYYCNTVADMVASTKLKSGDCVITLGYYSKNDGGSAKYTITSGLTNDIDVIGLSNGLQAQIILDDYRIDVRKFGLKPDANYYNIDGTGKYSYYSDSGKTIQATDNSSLLQSIMNKYSQRYVLYFVGSFCLNNPTELKMGSQLQGSSSMLELYGANFVTNNSSLDSFFFFTLTSADVPAQWHHSGIRNIHFNGGNNATYGVKIKGFGEASVIRECYFDKFNRAGAYIYGTSTSTPIELCSFMNNKYGIEVAQIEGMNATGSYYFDKISGDTNDALIYVHDDRTSTAASSLGLAMYFEIRSVKSESNNHILLIDKMSARASFKISGKLDKMRDGKYTSSTGTPYGVTIRNCSTIPYVDISLWSDTTGVILNDESNAKQVAADVNNFFHHITYGMFHDRIMGKDGTYRLIENVGSTTNTIDTTLNFPQITLYNTASTGTLYFTNGGLTLIDWTGGVTNKSIFPLSNLQVISTIKRIDTNTAQQVTINGNGKNIEKNGTIAATISIACGECVRLIYTTSDGMYHVL
jgi:hypothetical protein